MGKERIASVFGKGKKVLNVYFTAGYPSLGDTRKVMRALQSAGADLIEIGMPYSDPVADGPTIQACNQKALENGMNLRKLFEQLDGFRDEIEIPVVLMGYINPVLQFGAEDFVAQCQALGIDGTILPDLPLPEYVEDFKPMYDRAGLSNIFLISPQTSPKRVMEIDQATSGFIYMVSSNSITGGKGEMGEQQLAYFERINQMDLHNPRLIGFGISNHQSYTTACRYADGAIIGSAFLRVLQQEGNMEANIHQFVKKVKGETG